MANFCKKCGNKLSPGIKFCAKCGTPIGQTVPMGQKVQGTPSVQTVPPAAETENGWICASCGQENKSGKFCAKCGKAKEEQSASFVAPPISAPANVAASSAALQIPADSAPTDVVSPAPVSASETQETSAFASPDVIPPASATVFEEQTERVSAVPVDSRDAVLPDRGQKTMPSFSLQDGKWAKLLPVLVVLAVVAYFAISKFMVYRYDAKCGELVASMRETKELFEGVKEFSGDPESEGEKQFSERLMQNMERLKKQSSELEKMTPPEDKEGQHELFLAAVKKHTEWVRTSTAVIHYCQERLWTLAEKEKNTEALGKSLAAWKTAEEAVRMDMPLAAPNGEVMLDAAFYENTRMGTFAEYWKKREAFDKAYVADKLKEYHAQRDADNEKLKEKKEVVFLLMKVRNEGKDVILVGRFYNGTEDMVTGIKDMLVDIRFLRFEEEIHAIKDEPANIGISGIWLAPKESTNVIEIRLPGKVPKGYCNHFEVNMHKVRWNVRRAVQR